MEIMQELMALIGQKKELAKFNYTIEPLTKNEYNEIILNWKNKIAENVSEYEAQKLYDRSIRLMCV